MYVEQLYLSYIPSQVFINDNVIRLLQTDCIGSVRKVFLRIHNKEKRN